MMFWSMFNNLQLSPEQLRPHNGCLVDFELILGLHNLWVALCLGFLD